MPAEDPKALARGNRTIVWLASYPKSGNTWLRSLLHAYLYPDEPLDLNDLGGGPVHLARQTLDDYCAISSGEMLPEELIPYRAILHTHLAKQCTFPAFIKTHDAYTVGRSGQPLFPQECSAGAIYIARDPVDIAPSLAHHEGRDLDWTINRLADPHAALNQWTDKSSTALPEYTSGWSGNVASWFGQTEIPVLYIRYEDMHTDPASTLDQVLKFCSLQVDQSKIAAAVSACTFDALQRLEGARGFREKPSSQRAFFRSGKVGEGRATLSVEQQQSIIATHREWMEKLGYASEVPTESRAGLQD